MLFINFKCANYYLGQSYKIPESVFKKNQYNQYFEFLFQKNLSDLNGIDNCGFYFLNSQLCPLEITQS